MIPKIQNSPAYLADCERYVAQIGAVSEPVLKDQLIKLFIQFKEHVAYIDRDHENMLITGRIGTAVSDHRDSVKSLKQSLDRKLAAHQRSTAAN